ncbi:MAG TPA: FxDxF family PEP-CTERM protein [Sphingomicrobium sp.]|nr:FxDxF family PEP-CTERM protein [Sphingomicrobium sp.]
MLKSGLAIIGASALAFTSTSAIASETLTPINSATLNAAGTSGPFGAVIAGQSSFTDQFTFNLDNSAFTNGQVGTVALFNLLNINFTSIFIDSVANSFTKTSNPGNPEQWSLVSPASLASGGHILYVNGNLVNGPGNASYSGTLNISAVPELGTWGLMLLGFGAVGIVMRSRRRRMALAEVA